MASPLDFYFQNMYNAVITNNQRKNNKGVSVLNPIYHIQTTPAACPENIVAGQHYRITVLTQGLLRLEYSPDGVFEDRPTQTVLHRDFPKTNFRVLHQDGQLEIHTDRVHLVYNEKPFSPQGLSIQVKGGLTQYHSIWRYGQKTSDLGGTARTLDEANGAIPLESGILSRNGFAVLDDSSSQILLEDGWLEPRKKGIQDLYFWGYGHDYTQALQDFYHLCGSAPMLPRFALGNWWSRYYRYTQDSYLELMDRFQQENIPFTVGVIDMDWHLVDIDPKYGSGWTGYTWNRELFPDPPALLEELHRRGMKVTLNVHPAEGVQAHEEQYLPMAKEMGVDWQAEDPVACDPADPKFLEAYFKYLHHPLEEQGVDFWWIDWQQGSLCKVEGLDPLWILNHYHFLDSGRDGKRPLTFSRYAGPGSHRYPVGFSGDTIVTWESLNFQPYFTANASNIGYGWWSHDIGGHMHGYRNDELVTRWVQLGVFSPINRLHASNSPFQGKEPWRYKEEAQQAMTQALQERHRLVPYLYTMNYRAWKEGLPLVEPLYYRWSEAEESYQYKTQYCFGTQLMVSPVTTPRVQGLNVSKVPTWLPEGTWYDLYTGMVYAGGRTLDLYRSLDSTPVLAPAGAILPLTDEISGTQAASNPTSLRIKVFAGADGDFTLYEDDNTTQAYLNGVCVTTPMTYREADGRAVFTVHPAQGERSLIPSKRSFTVELTGFADAAGAVEIKVGETAASAQTSYDSFHRILTVTVEDVPVETGLEISLGLEHRKMDNDTTERCFRFLDQAEISFDLKDEIYRRIAKESRIPVLLGQLNALELDHDLYGALLEILTAW